MDGMDYNKVCQWIGNLYITMQMQLDKREQECVGLINRNSQLEQAYKLALKEIEQLKEQLQDGHKSEGTSG